MSSHLGRVGYCFGGEASYSSSCCMSPCEIQSCRFSNKKSRSAWCMFCPAVTQRLVQAVHRIPIDVAFS